MGGIFLINLGWNKNTFWRGRARYSLWEGYLIGASSMGGLLVRRCLLWAHKDRFMLTSHLTFLSYYHIPCMGRA
uniref:Uncharacterized protein n=1 Tax=Arundo donax TaxID=35708 RepID=A0A0A9GF63_ARUDO